MRILSLNTLAAGLVGAGSMFFAIGLPTAAGNGTAQAVDAPAKLVVDYPKDGSIFPPEITPPTFLWHEEAESATHWVVEVRFADHSAPLRVDAAGEHQKMGEIDPQAGTGDQL